MICPITGTGAEGNFYARGAWVNPPRDEDDEHGELFDKNSRVLGDHDHDEFYNGDSHVDVANPENPVWLRFVIKANSGSVAWKSTKVRVFSPIYGEYDSRVECRGEANTKNECIAKVSESGLPIPPALLDRDPQPDCTKTIGTRTTECLPETADRCGEAALSTTSCGLQDVQKTVQCCNADQNQGCANMSAPGDDQQCRFAATRDCGVSADDLSASSTGVRCAPGDIPLTLPQDFRQSSDGGLLYSRTSCDKPETPQGADLPDGLRRFASLHWGKVLEQAPVAIATGDVRPDEYRAAHSEYNCPFITPVMSNPLNLLPPQVRERSLLTGRHPMTCNWQEALREELGPYLGTGMYLNLSAEQVGERHRRGLRPDRGSRCPRARHRARRAARQTGARHDTPLAALRLHRRALRDARGQGAGWNLYRQRHRPHAAERAARPCRHRVVWGRRGVGRQVRAVITRTPRRATSPHDPAPTRRGLGRACGSLPASRGGSYSRRCGCARDPVRARTR